MPKNKKYIVKLLAYLFIYLLAPTNCFSQENKTKIFFGSPEPLENSPYVEINITSSLGNFFCSGTVIAKRKILTAAHCVDDDPSSISIITEGNNQIDVVKYSIHPDYRPLTVNEDAVYDLAVLTLAAKVPSNIKPVKLSSRKPKPGDEIFIYGYGLDEESNSGTLLFSTMEVQTVSSKLIFALGGGNTCSGDSGGPAILFYRSKGKLRKGIIGVTSFGSADCSLLDTTFSSAISNRAKRFIKRHL